jgi:hypothetical protein
LGCVIKEQAINLDNKHMLLYNLVKLLSMQNEIKKATFYC